MSMHCVWVQGVGKRVPLSLFRTQGRGGKGLRAIKLNEGDCLSALEVVHPHPSLDSVPYIRLPCEHGGSCDQSD